MSGRERQGRAKPPSRSATERSEAGALRRLSSVEEMAGPGQRVAEGKPD